MIQNIVNFVNLIGWVYVLVQTQIQVVFNLQNYLTSDISLTLNILRVVQLLQTMDLVMIFLGKAKGNVMASFFQIIGRNFVTLYVMEYDTHRLYFAGTVIIWSIADANRYLYYLYKNSDITGFLRYNSFLVLYPLGGVAQTLVFTDYFARHPDLNQYYYYFLRFVNACIIVGVIVLYKYMLNARRKWLKSKSQAKKKEEVKSE